MSPDSGRPTGLPAHNGQLANPFDATEESFLRKRDALLREVAEYDRIISQIREAKKRILSPAEQIPLVKPEEYVGMRAVDALAVYLRARRGMRIPLARAVQDLVAGGVDPGQPRGRKIDPGALITHTLKIALPNRKDTFGWEPPGLLKGIPDDQIMVWLAETAEMPRRRKRAKTA